jgi:hypothetical protein
MSLWTDLGFRDNPYGVAPIPPTEEGDQLLVGREVEIRQLRRSVESLDTHPTIEGENGVGKTSLVAVAGYRALQEFHRAGSQPLFVPVREPFQLSVGDSIDTFERDVYFRLARTFLDTE